MLRLLNIWFVVFCITGVAQNYSPVTEISFPFQVPINSSFDVSLLTDNSLSDADKLDLYIISKSNLEINSALIRTTEFTFRTKFIQSALPGIMDRVYQIQIDLRQDEYKIQSFLQILLNVNSLNSEMIKFSFYGEFIKDGETVSKIGSISNSNGDRSKKLVAEIKTYKPGRITKSAARLEINSSLDIDLKKISGSKLWIGFWLKLSGEDITVLKIVNSITNSVQSTFGINRFQNTYLLDENENIVNEASAFFSKKSWHHVGIEINTLNKSISFYNDGRMLGALSLSGTEQISDLKLAFGGTLSSTITIEQLRILKPKNGIAKIIDDSKYISISPHIASTVLQLNFDSMNELTGNAVSNFIKYSGIKLVNSDAPIFSRTPELNVQVLTTYNFLEWSSPDIKNASHFIVEKSLSGNDFIEIASVSVGSETNNKITYIDVSKPNEEIAYYRVMQVNKDGSSVYSPQVKIGMGNFEQFKLNQNYPNPFNPITSIEFDLYEDTEIEVIVYNLEGQEISVLQKGFLAKGIYKFDFDASDLPSGVYLYKVSSPVFSQSKKMLLTK